MQSNDKYVAMLVVIAFLTMGVVTVGKCGHAIGIHYERQKAIEAGVGRWVVDPATGNTEFKYGVNN